MYYVVPGHWDQAGRMQAWGAALHYQKVECKVAGSISRDGEVFWSFFTSKSRHNDEIFEISYAYLVLVESKSL